MAMEPKFPQDLPESKDSRRSTHITPSLTTDSEHEVLVELSSDSDIPSSKARKYRHASTAATTDRKKIADRKKRTSTSPFPGGPILSEDLLYHMMEQNKLLIDQNRALTKQVEILEPDVHSLPPPEAPFTCNHPLHPFIPEPVPVPVQPIESKSKTPEDDKLHFEQKEIWDAFLRLLRVVEAANKPTPDSNTAVGRSSEDDFDPNFPPLDLFDDMFPLGITRSAEDMLLKSKTIFGAALCDAERKFGITPKFKKGKTFKKAKAKTDTGKLMMLSKADLVPGVWKVLGLLRMFVLTFIMMQLSVIGGDLLRVSKDSPKNSAWLSLW